MADFLKIIRAEIKNFQSLEHKQIDLGGKSIAIIGRNGGGKSSLLRAIQSPINAQSIPSKAIKDGEERASVKIELAGEKDGEKAFYNYHLVFNAKSKKGKLSVTDAEGNKIESRDTEKTKYKITINSKTIALYIHIESNEMDFIASDNYFSMEPGESREIEIRIVSNNSKKDLDDIIKINSLFDLI